MLQIDASRVDAVRQATAAVDLYDALQKAIQLEHSTIPPYLLAAYSLQDGINGPIRRTLLEVAREEMLHMAIVCNVLNAIGGRPRIGDQDFVTQYPTQLPMVTNEGLVVGLKMYSPTLVEQTLMEIEEPERPIRFGSLKNLVNRLLARPVYSTIGAFYQAIIDKLSELGDPVFTGDATRQVSGQGTGFPVELLYPITNAADAIRALTWIVQDGEGTTTSPYDGSGKLSHYYRFAEIHHGRELAVDPTAADGYSYSGPAIPFDASQVHPFPDNPKLSDLADGSFEKQLVLDFNQAYCDMLRQLDKVFDGEPDQIRTTNNRMVALRGLAVSAMEFRTPEGAAAAVTFEYMPPVP